MTGIRESLFHIKLSLLPRFRSFGFPTFCPLKEDRKSFQCSHVVNKRCRIPALAIGSRLKFINYLSFG